MHAGIWGVRSGVTWHADDVGARGGHFVLEESEFGRVARGDVRRHFGPIGGGGGLASTSAPAVVRKFGAISDLRMATYVFESFT